MAYCRFGHCAVRIVTEFSELVHTTKRRPKAAHDRRSGPSSLVGCRDHVHHGVVNRLEESRTDGGAMDTLHGPFLGPPLERCPACGDDHLVGVVDTDAANFLCPACERCWHVEFGRVWRVDALACSGCSHRAECLGVLVREADLRSVGGQRADGRRAVRLAAGLRAIGVLPGTALAILVCDDHAADRAVGALAAQILGVSVTVCAVDLPVDALSECLQSSRHAVLLACAEGVEAWRKTGVPLRVVGDGPGVLWWRALELQQARPELRMSRGSGGS